MSIFYYQSGIRTSFQKCFAFIYRLTLISYFFLQKVGTRINAIYNNINNVFIKEKKGYWGGDGLKALPPFKIELCNSSKFDF